MKFIKLTSFIDNKPVFINPETIGHIYEETNMNRGSLRQYEKYTVVGTTCHNNGGFKVTETTDQILKLIKK